jgi:hypothetical protein
MAGNVNQRVRCRPMAFSPIVVVEVWSSRTADDNTATAAGKTSLPVAWGHRDPYVHHRLMFALQIRRRGGQRPRPAQLLRTIRQNNSR